VLVHHVVFALALDEVDHGDLPDPGEVLDGGHKRLTDRGEHRNGRDRTTQAVVDEPDQDPRVLQPGLVHVAIHPIDGFDLEHHMSGQDIASTAR
jgi:hypothetical protein